jgi:hypothetical protein
MANLIRVDSILRSPSGRVLVVYGLYRPKGRAAVAPPAWPLMEKGDKRDWDAKRLLVH